MGAAIPVAGSCLFFRIIIIIIIITALMERGIPVRTMTKSMKHPGKEWATAQNQGCQNPKLQKPKRLLDPQPPKADRDVG